MSRHVVRQAGAAVPIRILVPAIGTDWQTILTPPDFSIPDPQFRFPSGRDPNDSQRRIQPGFALVEAPLMLHNTSLEPVTVEVRILSENNEDIQQARIDLIARDTFLHPAPGQRLLKMTPSSEFGDRLQVRASINGVVQITAIASEGAAEEHEPEVN